LKFRDYLRLVVVWDANQRSSQPAGRHAKRKGLSSWVVNVPAELSETGKRQELFFFSKGEAQTVCNQLKVREDNFGTSLSELSSVDIIGASKAYQMLAPTGIGLVDAVSRYLVIHRQRHDSISFSDLCDRYLEAKSGKDPRHLKGLRNTRNRFPTLHSMLVSDIDHRVLEPLVNAVSPGGRNLVLRHFKSYFNFAIKKGFCAENPVARLDFVEIVRKEVETIAPIDVAKMLEHAFQNDLELLPYLTLGFFTGIRPEELRLLKWSDIEIPNRAITIRPEVSKTRKRRFPELSENAVEWLEAYRRSGGQMHGPITRLGEDALYAHRQKNRLAAGVTHWPQDAMRHTFCSMWLATNKDVNKLVLLSGHDSVDTMWRFYHRGTTEAEAKKFWAIKPPCEISNVVAFQQI
jgi:integrase